MDFGLLSRLAFLPLCAVVANIAHGEDTVHLSSPGNRQARSRISGEVVEYTGKLLVVALPEGREIKRPGQNVVAIETSWPAEKTEGDRLFDERQLAAAREKYATAIRAESRPWARRAILARLIACYRELNQPEAAGKLFIALTREDPDTPYFDEIPLAWMPGETQASLEQTAKQWLADDHEIAALLGASHLLTSREREKALDRLSELALEKDARVAALAEAQTWRASIHIADQEKLASWERRAETFPERLRAGPYWVLGRALSQHGEIERAAIALLHVPIIYPGARHLAAEALRSTTALLDKLDDHDAALRLNQELTENVSDRPAGVDNNVAPKATAPSSATGEPIEQTFLTGLRSRRLFALAELRCRQQLADTRLSESAQIDFDVELSRTLTEHALHEGQSEREQLWSKAIEAVHDPRLASIKGSRRLLLDSQEALVDLAHGELARQEAELAGWDAASLEAARRELRTAVNQLQATLKDVARELRQADSSRRTDAGDLNPYELSSLERNLRYQLARTFRNQGESYPPKSADRVNSLRQAVELLVPLETGDTDAIAWSARLDQIVCLRLLEDFESAGAKIMKIEELSPPPATAAAVQAEQIRLLLDLGRVDVALALAEKVQATLVESADLDYACLEAYLAAWRAAGKANRASDATQWQERAAALIQEIDNRFGRYWSRRAEMLLAGNVTRAGATQNLTVLIRAAESLYRSGQIDQSLAAYDRAIRQATESKQPQAFDFANTAAAIEQERGHHADAAKRFRAASLDDAANMKAADAHLLAIYNLALAEKQGVGGVSKQAYLDLLNEHLSHWPRSATAQQVRLWLGSFYERDERWSEAVDAYKSVPVDSQHATAAVEASARCYQRWLTSLAADGKPTVDLAAKAADYFEGLVIGARRGLPERWSQTQRLAATSAAAVWLQYGNGDFAKSERLLSAALTDSPDADDDWKSTAQTLLVFVLAAEGRRDDAATMLDELSGESPQQMLLLIAGLQRQASRAPSKVKKELAELQLAVAKRLKVRVNDLPADEQRTFQRAYVDALAATQRYDDAVAAARRLAESFPRDGEIQEQYAMLLVESRDHETLEAAAAKWRDIGQKTRQGSDRWLRSMYYQALAQERLGNRDQAARLVKFTEGLVPGLGGAEMKAKFRKLMREK